ncbi:MAG: hypothetical protein IJ408_01200 [Clostridia bacterium]|nr:hypothetical protein [Clostridia bacterium]
MSKKDIREQLIDDKIKFGFLKKVPCDKNKNEEYKAILKSGGSLPSGVYPYTDEEGELTDDFYKLYETELTDKEREEYLVFRKLALLNTIKNGVLFFVILTVISMACALFLTLTIL